MSIYVRHGQAESNVTGNIPLDIGGAPLTEEGRNQALRLASFIITEHPTVERIVSSPQTRCMETADVISRATGIEFEGIDPRLTVRCLGEAIGRSREYRQQFETYDDIPDAESTDAFMKRVRGIMDDPEDEGSTMLITHSGVIRCIAYLAAGGGS